MAISLSGCSPGLRVTEYVSFHKRTLTNGLPDRSESDDSVRVETSSRYLGDKLLLYSKSFDAEFRKPIRATDDVTYRFGVPDPSGPGGLKACQVDTGHMAYASEIPFAISDSLVRGAIGPGASLAGKIAFTYKITCGRDREEGEIHMIQSVHYETKPLGN